jgi:hypothetical protein
VSGPGRRAAPVRPTAWPDRLARSPWPDPPARAYGGPRRGASIAGQMGSMFLAAHCRSSGGSRSEAIGRRPAVVVAPWVAAVRALPVTFHSHLPAGKSAEHEAWLGKPGSI